MSILSEIMKNFITVGNKNLKNSDIKEIKNSIIDIKEILSELKDKIPQEILESIKHIEIKDKTYTTEKEILELQFIYSTFNNIKEKYINEKMPSYKNINKKMETLKEKTKLATKDIKEENEELLEKINLETKKFTEKQEKNKFIKLDTEFFENFSKDKKIKKSYYEDIKEENKVEQEQEKSTQEENKVEEELLQENKTSILKKIKKSYYLTTQTINNVSTNISESIKNAPITAATGVLTTLDAKINSKIELRDLKNKHNYEEIKKSNFLFKTLKSVSTVALQTLLMDDKEKEIAKKIREEAKKERLKKAEDEIAKGGFFNKLSGYTKQAKEKLWFTKFINPISAATEMNEVYAANRRAMKLNKIDNLSIEEIEKYRIVHIQEYEDTLNYIIELNNKIEELKKSNSDNILEIKENEKRIELLSIESNKAKETLKERKKELEDFIERTTTKLPIQESENTILLEIEEKEQIQEKQQKEIKTKMQKRISDFLENYKDEIKKIVKYGKPIVAVLGAYFLINKLIGLSPDAEEITEFFNESFKNSIGVDIKEFVAMIENNGKLEAADLSNIEELQEENKIKQKTENIKEPQEENKVKQKNENIKESQEENKVEQEIENKEKLDLSKLINNEKPNIDYISIKQDFISEAIKKGTENIESIKELSIEEIEKLYFNNLSNTLFEKDGKIITIDKYLDEITDKYNLKEALNSEYIEKEENINLMDKQESNEFDNYVDNKKEINIEELSKDNLKNYILSELKKGKDLSSILTKIEGKEIKVHENLLNTNYINEEEIKEKVESYKENIEDVKEDLKNLKEELSEKIKEQIQVLNSDIEKTTTIKIESIEKEFNMEELSTHTLEDELEEEQLINIYKEYAMKGGELQLSEFKEQTLGTYFNKEQNALQNKIFDLVDNSSIKINDIEIPQKEYLEYYTEKGEFREEDFEKYLEKKLKENIIKETIEINIDNIDKKLSLDKYFDLISEKYNIDKETLYEKIILEQNEKNGSWLENFAEEHNIKVGYNTQINVSNNIKVGISNEHIQNQVKEQLTLEDRINSIIKDFPLNSEVNISNDVEASEENKIKVSNEVSEEQKILDRQKIKKDFEIGKHFEKNITNEIIENKINNPERNIELLKESYIEKYKLLYGEDSKELDKLEELSEHDILEKYKSDLLEQKVINIENKEYSLDEYLDRISKSYNIDKNKLLNYIMTSNISNNMYNENVLLGDITKEIEKLNENFFNSEYLNDDRKILNMDGNIFISSEDLELKNNIIELKTESLLEKIEKPQISDSVESKFYSEINDMDLEDYRDMYKEGIENITINFNGENITIDEMVSKLSDKYDIPEDNLYNFLMQGENKILNKILNKNMFEMSDIEKRLNELAEKLHTKIEMPEPNNIYAMYNNGEVEIKVIPEEVHISETTQTQNRK